MMTDISIGNYRLSSRVLAAPMSGVTDLPFRRVLQSFGPGLVVSEMVASETLLKGDAETEARAAGRGEINPLVIQLVGREPDWMAKGARQAELAGADIIDINMGCPARKVTTGLSGSALMKDPVRASEIVHAIIGATSRPVTLKMRLGWDDKMLNAPEIAQMAEKAGVKLLVVHGRTRCQFYKGKANWEAVSETKSAVNLPVFVNGDIDTAEDAKTALQASACDGVMLGRGLVGQPWLINKVRSEIDQVPVKEPSAEEKIEMCQSHYDDVLDFYGEGKGIRVARKHLAGYVEKNYSGPDAAALKSKICQSVDPIEVRSLLTQVFNKKSEEVAA